MAKFRRIPAVIEAVKVGYAEMLANGPECSPFSEQPEWLTKAVHAGDLSLSTRNARDYAVVNVKTLHGTVEAVPGDWILRSVDGDLYPCRGHIFAATYESAE